MLVYMYIVQFRIEKKLNHHSFVIIFSCRKSIYLYLVPWLWKKYPEQGTPITQTC